MKEILWTSEFGRNLRSFEQTELQPVIKGLVGNTVVWLGSDHKTCDLLQDCMVRNPIHIACSQPNNAAEHVYTCVAEMSLLPFASRSVEAVVVHHGLEQCDDPRAVLREIRRILVPGGKVVIVGFNPYSWLSLKRVYATLFEDPLSLSRLINPLKLFDWLAVLGLQQTAKPKYLGGLLPFQFAHQQVSNQTWHKFARWLNLPFGGLMLVQATKLSGAQLRPTQKAKPNAQTANPKLAPVAYPTIASWQRKSDL